MLSIYIDEKGTPFKTAGKIDYVAAWYYKAAEYMISTNARTAFVSTNSITQGEQVASVWKPLFDMFGISIDFAHRSFEWTSEASDKAAVHCVIVGFSANYDGERVIFDGETKVIAANISPYLIDNETVFIESRRQPLCDVVNMVWGSKPVDGGHLIIEAKECEDFIKNEPLAEKYIKRLMGGEELINNKIRYCLWLTNISPSELMKMPLVMKRISEVRLMRENSKKEATRRLADTPVVFAEIRQPNSEYIAIPEVSSDSRRYIPMGFLNPDIIASNLLQLIPNATLYHFGILTSNVHMAWMRVVAGRLGRGYRYSGTIVYNNFPWPDATDTQKAEIEKLAQGVLDARNEYPDSTLADMYGETSMLPR